MKNKILIGLICLLLVVPAVTDAAESRYNGYIYLQVQEHGEAWYVSPTNSQRYYLGRPFDAYNVMWSLGLGISNQKLKTLPIGLLEYGAEDIDHDGLPNDLEIAIGTSMYNSDTDNDSYDDKTEVQNWYNPDGPEKMTVDQALVDRLKGRILLQVESKGEAWYVYPKDGKRYYLGRPADAYEVMRKLGIGITNSDLDKIEIDHEAYNQKYPYKAPSSSTPTSTPAPATTTTPTTSTPTTTTSPTPPATVSAPTSSPSNFKLPGNRTIPSSQRKNLVWADQLILGVGFGITDGRMKFAANNYVGVQKMSGADVAKFREYNPNFLQLIYHLSNGINPKDNGNVPEPRNAKVGGNIQSVTPQGYVSEWDNYFEKWLELNFIGQNSPRYENMFQHYDQLDSSHRVWHIDPYWLMNLENPDWRNYIADTTINWLEGTSSDGAFLDVSHETCFMLYHPNANDKVGFSWWKDPHGPYGITDKFAKANNCYPWQNEQYLKYYQALYQRYHTNKVDYLVIPNVGEMITNDFEPTWLDGDSNGQTIDGAMLEGWGNSSYGYDMYLSMKRTIEHLTGNDKILIAQFYNGQRPEHYRRTGMYMLVKNDKSYLNILGKGHYKVMWYPEYEIDLGSYLSQPETIEDLRVGSGDGWQNLWKRDYERGAVVCNTSGSAMDYTLPAGNWSQVETTLDGDGEVSVEGIADPMSVVNNPISGKISVPKVSCVILSK